MIQSPTGPTAPHQTLHNNSVHSHPMNSSSSIRPPSIWADLVMSETREIRLGINTPYTDITRFERSVRAWARTQKPPRCVHFTRADSRSIPPQMSADLRARGIDALLTVDIPADCPHTRCQTPAPAAPEQKDRHHTFNASADAFLAAVDRNQTVPNPF